MVSSLQLLTIAISKLHANLVYTTAYHCCCDDMLTQIDELVEHVTLRTETQAEQLQQLRELWDRLRTPQADREKFLADLANDGISEDGMTRYYNKP
jgi:hypothetical protein